MENSRIVFIGLSITSSWGNGHATTYRALVRELTASGHQVLFLEHDKPWYARNRDMPVPPWGETKLYRSFDELQDLYSEEVENADFVIVGSYVPKGIDVGEWVTRTARGITAFYDIDTPITITKLERGTCEYLSPELIPKYNIYLSFTGGPILNRIEKHYGSPMARALYCSAEVNSPRSSLCEMRYDLGYMGTYSFDRQPSLEQLMLLPARRWRDGHFVVAGPQYPLNICWPENVERIEHVAPPQHPSFYGSQRFTLNITREQMIQFGYSPSVRLFEAGACGTAIISDWWEGLDSFFVPGSEILISRSPEDTLRYLREIPESERSLIAAKSRMRVLRQHTAAHRVAELEDFFVAAREAGARLNIKGGVS